MDEVHDVGHDVVGDGHVEDGRLEGADAFGIQQHGGRLVPARGGAGHDLDFLRDGGVVDLEVEEKAVELGVKKVELDELFGNADFITLHVPKNEKRIDPVFQEKDFLLHRRRASENSPEKNQCFRALHLKKMV